MTIRHKNEGGTLTVAIEGRLDTTTAPEFESFITENISEASSLVIDCAGLDYVSSAGLRVLLSVQKKMGSGVKLISVNELVMEVFEMTGFADILTIE